MAGRRILVGYLTVPVGIRLWHRIAIRVWIDPVTTWSGDINVGIIAPASAIVLEDVPAWSVCKEPSLKPARVIDISRILSVKPTARIPLIKPYAASS